MTYGLVCIGLSEGFVYKGLGEYLILMERLERVADDIVRGYVSYRSPSSLPSAVCLYNGGTLNGELERLGELVRRGLRTEGISLSSLTLSHAPVSVIDQYGVDVEWFMQKHAAVSET